MYNTQLSIFNVQAELIVIIAKSFMLLKETISRRVQLNIAY